MDSYIGMIIYACCYGDGWKKEDAYYVCVCVCVCVRDSYMLVVDQGENAQCLGEFWLSCIVARMMFAIAVYMKKREETHKDIILLERKR